MPYYLFEFKNKVKEIFFHMNDKKEYIDEKGNKWTRIFSNPLASVDTKINPFDEKDFVNKTAKKGMTIGQMWDESAQLSEKRQQILGKDNIREQAEQKYFEKTKKIHPHAKKQKLEIDLTKAKISV